MRAEGLRIVRHALEHGCITWRPDGVMELEFDEAMIRAILPHRQTVDAVLRRAQVFRMQLTTPDAEPFCHFRASRWWKPGLCRCCHGALRQHESLDHCDLCSVAAEVALAAPTQVEQRAEG